MGESHNRQRNDWIITACSGTKIQSSKKRSGTCFLHVPSRFYTLLERKLQGQIPTYSCSISKLSEIQTKTLYPTHNCMPMEPRRASDSLPSQHLLNECINFAPQHACQELDSISSWGPWGMKYLVLIFLAIKWAYVFLSANFSDFPNLLEPTFPHGIATQVPVWPHDYQKA